MVASRILDHKGNPIDTGLLLEEQSERQESKLGMLHREFADHPTRGLTPARLARILDEAETGNLKGQCDLFEDMEEKDGHIYAELSKRKRVIAGLEWSIHPPRNASTAEQKQAELVEEIIRDIDNFEDVILDMADAIGKGFSNSEIEWDNSGKEWVPDEIIHRPSSWFMVPQHNRDDIRLRDTSGMGEPLQPFGWIEHVHKAKSGYVTRGGLHRVLAWPFLFKNYSIRDLAEFLEIYGLPLRLGKYQAGASEEDKATLLRAVVGIGHAAAGIIPQGMEIEFKDAAKGQSDPYQAMLDWCEKTQSKAILGGTLTSQADGASSTNALGNVHNEVRHDLLVADARQVASTLKKFLVYPIAALNGSGISPRRAPNFVFDTREPEDMALYAEALPKLVGIGMRIPEQYAHDKLNIPIADDDEAVLAVPSQGVPLKQIGTAKLKAAGDSGGDSVAALVDQLESEVQPITDKMIDQVKQLMDEVESLEELADRIPELLGDMDTKQLTELMAKAFATADLTGQQEVVEESNA